jgi:uridylate kinase
VNSPYKRVLLKLSGEVFGGGHVGVDPDVVAGLAQQIATVVAGGTQVAVVVGGGNFFRGAELQRHGMDRDRADYMGMLGTVMNCLALQDFCEKAGVQTRVQTAITMGQVAEPYIPRRAERHLERAGSSSSALAPGCRTSPPTPWPRSARWRSARRCC